MGIQIEPARARTRRVLSDLPSDDPLPSNLASLDLSDPRVRAMPVGTLALVLGAATAARADDAVSQAATVGDEVSAREPSPAPEALP